MVCRGNWGFGGVGGGGRIVPGSFVVAGLRLWNLRSVGFGAWSGGGGNLRSVGLGMVRPSGFGPSGFGAWRGRVVESAFVQ